MLDPALRRPDGGGLRRISLADEQLLVQLEGDPVYGETVKRFVALRLLDWGMRKKDACYLTRVSEYFIDNTAAPLERHRGAAAGPWTLCRHREARREAAMFLHEWQVARQPCVERPSAVALGAAYCRYYCWDWRDARRDQFDPSAALAIIRNVASGQLLLRRCLSCHRLSLQPHKPDGVARGGASCSFCNCAHTAPVALSSGGLVPEPS